MPDDAYLVRDATALSIASHGYLPALAAAEADLSVPIWLHTHPGNGSTPRPSKRDEIVDGELTDLFRLRSGSPLYGAIVVSRTGEGLCFAGQAKARAEGRFPGRRPSLTAQQRDYIRVERSKGVSQRELAMLLEVSRWTIQQVDR